MAVSKAGVLAGIVTILALVGCSFAQVAPAPAPASSAGVASPSLAVCCAAAVSAFVFGFAVKI